MSRKVSKSDSPHFVMTKVLQAIVKGQESAEKAIEKYKASLEIAKETHGELFKDLNYKIEETEEKIKRLGVKYEQEKKDQIIRLDQSLSEYGYEKAVEILEERNEIAVPSKEYNTLKAELEQERKGNEDKLRNCLENERKRHTIQINSLKKTTELEKKAEVAVVKAQLETQVKQIEILNATITRLTQDLEAQRRLTKDVAQAQASKPTYIQSSGPSR